MQKSTLRVRLLRAISWAMDALSYLSNRLGGITVWTCDCCDEEKEMYGTECAPKGWLSYGDEASGGRVWCSEQCAAHSTEGQA